MKQPDKPKRKRIGPKPLTIYDERRTPTVVLALAALGKTDAEIAFYMGITPQCLSTWKDQHPSINEALNDAHRGVDKEIENALAKAALGIESTSELVRGKMDANGTLIPTDVTKAKQKTPSVTAMIFWLKNRRPKEWRDQTNHEFSGTVQHNIAIGLPAKKPVEEIPEAIDVEVTEK